MTHWSEKAMEQAQSEMGGSDMDSGASGCPAEKTGLIVQVLRPEAEQYIGKAKVTVDGTDKRHGVTSSRLGVTAFQPILGGNYQVTVDFDGEMEKNYTVSPDTPPTHAVETGKIGYVSFEVGVWIEIELTDEKGQPAKDYKYRIEQPEGTVIKEGTLSASGTAEVRDVGELNIGEAKITFVPPDQVLPAPAPDKNWITVELIGKDGKPAKDQDYELWLREGKSAHTTGKLDAKGQATLKDLGESVKEFQVVFPEEAELPADPEPSKNWITIELIGRDGKPAKDQDWELWLRGEDSAHKTGKLDGNGQAKFTDLSETITEFQVVFPGLPNL